MNRRFAATMELQRHAPRDPASLIAYTVCPHCKRTLSGYFFIAEDGHHVEAYHCPTHGDVVPMRSHVHNSD